MQTYILEEKGFSADDSFADVVSSSDWVGLGPGHVEIPVLCKSIEAQPSTANVTPVVASGNTVVLILPCKG